MFPNIPIGRVELDPMRVPTPFRLEGGPASFEQQFQSVTRKDGAGGSRDTDRESSRDTTAAGSSESQRSKGRAEPVNTEARTEPIAGSVEQGAAKVDQNGSEAAIAPVVLRQTERGGSGPVLTQDPSTRLSSGPATQEHGVAPPTTPKDGTGVVVAVGGLVPAPVNAQVRAVDGAPRPEATLPKTGTTGPLAGYRSLQPGTLRLAEQARDSVFRQVALRVMDGGSQLRVLMDPPELGHLDLRMSIDKSGLMRLSIGAERPEMVLMLDKHMHELRQSLSSHGLSLAQTDVHAQHGRRDAQGAFETMDHHRHEDGAEEGINESPAALSGFESMGDSIEWWA